MEPITVKAKNGVLIIIQLVSTKNKENSSNEKIVIEQLTEQDVDQSCKHLEDPENKSIKNLVICKNPGIAEQTQHGYAGNEHDGQKQLTPYIVSPNEDRCVFKTGNKPHFPHLMVTPYVWIPKYYFTQNLNLHETLQNTAELKIIEPNNGQNNEYWKNLSLEAKQQYSEWSQSFHKEYFKILGLNQEHKQDLSPERKVQLIIKSLERWKDMNPEMREEAKLKLSQWWENVKNTEEMKQKKCKRKPTEKEVEQIKRIKWMHAYTREVCPENMETFQNEIDREICAIQKLMKKHENKLQYINEYARDYIELARKEQNLAHLEKIVKRYTTLKEETAIQESDKDIKIKNFLCCMCQKQFLNSTALVEHTCTTRHITPPEVAVLKGSRIEGTTAIEGSSRGSAHFSAEKEEERIQKNRKYLKKISAEEKILIKQDNLLKSLSPDKKEEMRQKILEYWEKLSSDIKEKRRQKRNESVRKYRKAFSLEKKEEIRQKCHEYLNNLSSEKKEKMRQRKREHWNNLTHAKKEQIRQKQYERYWKKKAEERKKTTEKLKRNMEYRKQYLRRSIIEGRTAIEGSNGLKQENFCHKCKLQFLNNTALLEHIIRHVTLPEVAVLRRLGIERTTAIKGSSRGRINLSAEKKEERNQKKCEYWKKISSKKKELIKQYNHLKDLSSDKKDEMRQHSREYWNNLKPEKKKEIKQKKREGYMKKKAEKRKKTSEKQERNMDYCKQNLRKSGIEGTTAMKGFNIDLKQENFCHKCKLQFLNNTDLLEHIIGHVTLPTIIMSRIDQKTIKTESEYPQIYIDTSQNENYVKTDCIKYEDITLELNYSVMDIKTSDVDIDEVSFYTYVKEEG